MIDILNPEWIYVVNNCNTVYQNDIAIENGYYVFSYSLYSLGQIIIIII